MPMPSRLSAPLLLLATLLPAALLSQQAALAQPGQSGTDAVPASFHPQLTSGYTLMREGRYVAAIEAFESSEPKTAEIYNQLGIAAEHMYMDVRAKDYFEQALRMDPQMANVFNNLGTVYYNEKAYGTAERCYKKAIRLDSRNAFAYSNLGTLYFGERKFGKGIKAYRKAFALDRTVFDGDPENTIASGATRGGLMELNYNLARLFAQQSTPQKAMAFLEKAVSEGFHDRKRLLTDPAFASLRTDPPFVALVKQMSS